MAGIATVNVVGNLGRDPETGITPTGRTNVKFSVAVSRKTRDGAETVAWYAVTCWGALADKLTDLTQQKAIGKAAYLKAKSEYSGGAFQVFEADIDAVAGDVIVQVACFGDVVYG